MDGHDGLAVLRAQRRQGFDEDEALGRVRGLSAQAPDPRLVDRLGEPGTLAKGIPDDVAGDGEEPRPHTGLVGVIALTGLPGAEERLLGALLGSSWVADRIAAEEVDLPPVLVEGLVEVEGLPGRGLPRRSLHVVPPLISQSDHVPSV